MATGQRVVIGMDPHKRSVTIEVMTADEGVLGGGRFGTDVVGFTAMTDYVKQWPDRVWAIEGCSGIGRHVAMRLIGDGQDVVDVPPKLSARARVFSTGQGRKTDATDAHSVALVGTRMAGLRPVVADDQLTVLRMLADRRRSLGEEHTRKVSQLHALLLELLPGGAKKDLSAAQAKALLAKVRPRDLVGKTRRRLAAELVGDLEQIYARKKAADKELKALVAATGTGLLRPARHRTVRGGTVARRGRRHHQVPRPQPLRVLDRHRTHRRIIRRPRPAPALARREPTDQPRAAHHGHRPAPQPDRRTRLLRPQEGRREVLQRGHALPQTTTLRRRLPRHGRRPRQDREDGSGRATRQRLLLQRDQLTAQSQLFGKATSRTRHHPA